MARLAGLLLRVILSFSLALLPGAQAMAMASAMNPAGESSAAPCHGMQQGMDSRTDAGAPVDLDPSADSCCGTPQCHCLSAMALPSLPRLIQARLPLAWEVWLPLRPNDPHFAPTPPPPRP